MEPVVLSPKAKSRLEPLDAQEIESVATSDRRAETFLLYSTGWKQSEIARYFHVSQSTVSSDLKFEFSRRRARAQNIEDEIERIVGVVEGVITSAWKRHNAAADAAPGSVAGASYLKIVLEAAEKLAQLRGIDGPKAATVAKGQTRVIVQIGGTPEQPAIQVGVEA